MSTSSTLAPLSGVTLPQGQSTTTADLAAGGPRRRPIDRAPLLSVDAIRQLHADRDAKKPKNTTSSGGQETGDSSFSNAPNWSVSYHRQALSTASEGTPGVLAAARNVLSSAASPHATMYQSPQRRRLAEAQLENEKSANEILDLEKRNREQQSFDISDISGAAVGNSSLRSSLAGPDVGSLEYLRNHSVVPLFNELLAELLAQKPENPIDYLLENLKEIQGDVSQARQQLERKSVHQLVKGRKEESSIADEAPKSLTPPQPDAEGGAGRVVDTVTPSEAFAAIVREGTDDVPLVASVLAVAAGSSSIAAKGEEEVEPTTTNTVEDASEEEAPVDVEVVGDNKVAPNPEGSPAPQTVVPTLTTTEDEDSTVSPFENITYSTTNSNNQNPVEDEKEEEVEDSSSSVDRHRSGGNIVESNLLDGYSSDQLDRMSSAVPYLFLMTQSGSTAVEGVSVSMAPVGIQLLLRSFIVPNMQRSPSLPRSGPLNPIAVKKLVCLSALAQSATSSEQPNLGIDLLIKAAGTAIQLEGFSFPTSLAASPRAIDVVSATTTNPPPALTSRDEDEEGESANSTRAVELTTSPTREGAQQDDVEDENDETTNTESKNEEVDDSSDGKQIVNTGFKGVDAVAQAAQSMNSGKPLAGLDMLVSACESASTSANGSRVGSATTGNNHNKNRVGGDVQPVVETPSSNHEAIDDNGSSTQDSTANAAAAAAAVQHGDEGEEQATTTAVDTSGVDNGGGSNDDDEATVMYPCLALLSALLGTTDSHIQYLTEAAQQRRRQQQ